MPKSTRTIRSITDLDPSDLLIKWRMTEMCNGRCSYCLRKKRDQLIDSGKLGALNNRLCEVADRISALVEKTRFSNVKIDLIGGEVSILDLAGISRHLTAEAVKTVNMTTNLLRSGGYYSELCDALHSSGKKLTATASFHFEMQSFEDYFRKIDALEGKFDILCCEMVSTPENQELCKKFISRCEKMGIDYMCEADLRMCSFEARRKGLVTGGSKKRKGGRYRVVFTDGTEKVYTSRNDLLTDSSNAENRLRKLMRTDGFICSNSYDFVYIDFDTVHGRTEDSDDCTNEMPIEDFKIVPPRPCAARYCSLCGHMSLWREETAQGGKGL